jgi:hypothetical protein
MSRLSCQNLKKKNSFSFESRFRRLGNSFDESRQPWQSSEEGYYVQKLRKVPTLAFFAD